MQLAACYRVFDQLGWTEMIFNHITLRVPGPERVFLINPFGLMYHEVTASNLVAVDIDGHPVRPTEHAVNRAGFVTHSAIHGHVEGALRDAHPHHQRHGGGLPERGCRTTRSTARSCTAAWPTTSSRASPSTPTSARACSRASATSGA